jgi:hypothetical protein
MRRDHLHYGIPIGKHEGKGFGEWRAGCTPQAR